MTDYFLIGDFSLEWLKGHERLISWWRNSIPLQGYEIDPWPN
jgi:hypothetical protein